MKKFKHTNLELEQAKIKAEQQRQEQKGRRPAKGA